MKIQMQQPTKNELSEQADTLIADVLDGDLRILYASGQMQPDLLLQLQTVFGQALVAGLV
jgi:hypothetical protein